MTASGRRSAGAILVLGIKHLAGELLGIMTSGMLIDVNHNRVCMTEIVFSPKVAIRYATFDDWLVVTHLFYHLEAIVPAARFGYSACGIPDDVMADAKVNMRQRTKKPPRIGG